MLRPWLCSFQCEVIYLSNPSKTHSGQSQGVRLFFGTDFTDYTDFLALEGHSSAFRLHAEVFEKREITGRNITVMVRRIDTCQGLKSQLPKRPQFFRRYFGYSGRFFQGFWVCFFWHGFHGLRCFWFGKKVNVMVVLEFHSYGKRAGSCLLSKTACNTISDSSIV